MVCAGYCARSYLLDQVMKVFEIGLGLGMDPDIIQPN